ncbi:MAG: hypothetical protein V4723_00530 [Pseudomonadota bacterium]
MIRTLVLALTLGATCTASFASCMSDGASIQSVELSIVGAAKERWEPVTGKIHRMRLPSGFELGVQIDPATKEKYQQLLEKLPAIDELVKITLFDMRESSPVELSTTWGGTNSIQGFGPRGGANKVAVMPEQVQLWLHKPVCLNRESLKSRQ